MRHTLPLAYIDAVARAGSIRQAAEMLAITSTALNRRILAMEEELGVALFERLPRGVRPTTAGEILIHHARAQFADLERVKSQIADLAGERRGHVAIACSQALLPFFLPEQIGQYRRLHPGVTFGVHRRDREAAEHALIDHLADLALVFEPLRLAEFQTLMVIPQPVFGIMHSDHPLAGRETLRLGECLQFPITLPTANYGVRTLLEGASAKAGLKLRPAVESDSFEFLRSHSQHEPIVSFQIPIGLPRPGMSEGLIIRPLDRRDVPTGYLHLGQLRRRTLPVAAARFADQLQRVMEKLDAEILKVTGGV